MLVEPLLSSIARNITAISAPGATSRHEHVPILSAVSLRYLIRHDVETAQVCPETAARDSAQWASSRAAARDDDGAARRGCQMSSCRRPFSGSRRDRAGRSALSISSPAHSAQRAGHELGCPIKLCRLVPFTLERGKLVHQVVPSDVHR